MLKLGNHFEQIPLEIVRKIIDAQVQQEEIAGRSLFLDKKKSDEDLVMKNAVGE